MKATIIICVVLGVWVCGAFCSEQMAEGKNSWKLQKELKNSGVGRIKKMKSVNGDLHEFVRLCEEKWKIVELTKSGTFFYLTLCLFGYFCCIDNAVEFAPAQYADSTDVVSGKQIIFIKTSNSEPGLLESSWGKGNVCPVC